jgi:hypothetical protein
MTIPTLTDAEKLAARSFSLTDAEYAFARDNPRAGADEIERQSELERKARERLDEEQALEAERARRAAA